MHDFILGFFLAIFIFFYPLFYATVALVAVHKCEEKLPRNIECRITAEPMPEIEGE